jgi:hypothetical protein
MLHAKEICEQHVKTQQFWKEESMRSVIAILILLVCLFSVVVVFLLDIK